MPKPSRSNVNPLAANIDANAKHDANDYAALGYANDAASYNDAS